jgi:hypothetical protein
MAAADGFDQSRLQFVIDALRTMSSATAIDLTTVKGRSVISTNDDLLRSNGHRAIRNNDGTGMTLAQIATASGLTAAQVLDLAGRV